MHSDQGFLTSTIFSWCCTVKGPVALWSSGGTQHFMSDATGTKLAHPLLWSTMAVTSSLCWCCASQLSKMCLLLSAVVFLGLVNLEFVLSPNLRMVLFDGFERWHPLCLVCVIVQAVYAKQGCRWNYKGHIEEDLPFSNRVILREGKQIFKNLKEETWQLSYLTADG